MLIGDATAELPRLVTEARELVRNMTAITAPDAPLAASLGNVQTVTERLKGPRGALGVLMGNERDAQKIVAALDRTNALLARMDGLVARADAQVFGDAGLVPDARAAIAQLNETLGQARATLKQVDAVLAEVQAIAVNTKVATTDLGALRAEIEVNLRKIESLVDEINRRWPFARDNEIRLP